MTSGSRRKSIAFFIVLGACLTAGALALNIGWVIVNWRAAGMLILGLLAFPLIITGVVLNTIFLVREIPAERAARRVHQFRDSRAEDARGVDPAVPPDPAEPGYR